MNGNKPMLKKRASFPPSVTSEKADNIRKTLSNPGDAMHHACLCISALLMH
jgi:hypothetical protein